MKDDVWPVLQHPDYHGLWELWAVPRIRRVHAAPAGGQQLPTLPPQAQVSGICACLL